MGAYSLLMREETAMPRKGRSDLLDLWIEEEHWERAKAARNYSSRCAIAQGVKDRIGPKSKPIADMDYIRVTDPETGDRLFYRTPPNGQALIIDFDAGIKPQLPIRIRARLAHQRKKWTGKDKVSIGQVRAWAKNQPNLQVAQSGQLSGAVITAYKIAHPGASIHSQQTRIITVKSSGIPKSVVEGNGGGNLDPPIGNLANSTSVPPSRRRTFGTMKLTKVLIEAGWTPPAADSAA